MRTNKRIEIPGTEVTTITTLLRSEVRVNDLNKLSFFCSFVFNELPELEESPRVEPSIESLTFTLLPDTFQVFECDYIRTFDDLFTYIMVDPTHVTFLSTRLLLQSSFSRLCAFTLQSFPKKMMLEDSSFVAFENLTVRTDCQVIYAEINTQKLVSARNWSVDLSSKCDVEEHSTFFISYDLKGLITPIQIFPVIFRDSNWHIHPLSQYKSCDSDIISPECEKVTVETYWTGFQDWSFFKLRRFKVFRSFCDCFTRKICWQPLPKLFIDQMMEFEPIRDFSFKPFIDSKLCSLQEDLIHSAKFFNPWSFNLDCGNKLHGLREEGLIFKELGRMSSEKQIGGCQFTPQLKQWVPLA